MNSEIVSKLTWVVNRDLKKYYNLPWQAALVFSKYNENNFDLYKNIFDSSLEKRDIDWGDLRDMIATAYSKINMYDVAVQKARDNLRQVPGLNINDYPKKLFAINIIYFWSELLKPKHFTIPVEKIMKSVGWKSNVMVYGVIKYLIDNQFIICRDKSWKIGETGKKYEWIKPLDSI